MCRLLCRISGFVQIHSIHVDMISVGGVGMFANSIPLVTYFKLFDSKQRTKKYISVSISGP